jgi:hypothetical protein
MRNLLALLALIAIAFLGLGWYLDWYRIEKGPSSSGRSTYQIEIDRNKISDDSRRFFKEGSDKIQEALEERQAPDTDSRARTNQAGEVEEAEPRDGAMKPKR